MKKPWLAEPQDVVPVRFTANFDEPLESKIARAERDVLVCTLTMAIESNFPCALTGSREVTGRVVRFGPMMSEEELDSYADDERQIYAPPKAIVDLALANPRPLLDKQMPMSTNVFWKQNGDPRRYVLCLQNGNNGERVLAGGFLGPDEDWDSYLWFLFLDKF